MHDPTFDHERERREAEEGGLVRLIRLRAAMDSAQFEPEGWKGDPAAQRAYLVRFIDDREFTRENPIPMDRAHEPDWEHPRTPKRGASKTKLWEVLDKPPTKGERLTYLYDYGDCWEHEISVVGTAPAKRKIECVAGEGHYIAEDAGCYNGWKNVLEAYRAKKPSKEQMEKRWWFEKMARNGDPRGLGGDGARRWDQEGINRKLSVLL